MHHRSLAARAGGLAAALAAGLTAPLALAQSEIRIAHVYPGRSKPMASRRRQG